MTEPIPAAGGAPRRWWDLTPKELNIVAFTLLFLITLPMLTKIFTSDFGTHIALGRQIVQNHHIPTSERWNYPSLGMENGSGGEWGFAGGSLPGVLRRGGVRGLVHGLGGRVRRSSFSCTGRWCCAGRIRCSTVLAIFAFSGFLRIRIQPRPEIFTYLFIALTIFLLSEYYFGTRKKADLPVSPDDPRVGEQPPDVPDGVRPLRRVLRRRPRPGGLEEGVPVGPAAGRGSSPR